MSVNNDSDILSDTSVFSSKNPLDKKCAPSKKYTLGSCIPLNSLIKMAEAYNIKYPDNSIILSNTLYTLNPTKYKKSLLKQFHSRFKNICDDQKCWINQSYVNLIDKSIKYDLKKYTFRPDSPQGKYEWLNTLNINDVMYQYEKKYPDFKFLGTVPADFQQIPPLSFNLKFNFQNTDFLNDLFDNGYRKFGMVFNLDEHNKSGSHWVALYSDFDKHAVYFSDSYGIEPEPRFRHFMRNLARFIQLKYNIPQHKLDVRHNTFRHQYGNSECGVYSLFFIINLLNGVSFDKLSSKRISDDFVNSCRDIYFF